jgi:hypothetical protein
MQTTTGISSMHIAMSENTTALSHEELLSQMMRAAGKTDWDLVISKIDRQISRSGVVVLALSALYFAPILVSMLLR